jgi:hypothetical protein
MQMHLTPVFLHHLIPDPFSTKKERKVMNGNNEGKKEFKFIDSILM